VAPAASVVQHRQHRIKAGVSQNGVPYVDMNDAETAKFFAEQSALFDKVSLG